jgi:hypothetical protein
MGLNNMPTFKVTARTQTTSLVTFSVYAETEEEAKQVTQTGQCEPEETEILNTDLLKIINVEEAYIH